VTKHAAEDAAAELSALTGNNVRGHPLELNDRQSITDLFMYIQAQFGRLDVLINNAYVINLSLCILQEV